MKVTPRTIAYLTLLVHWGPSNALSYGWGFLILFVLLLAKPEWFHTNGVYSTKAIKYTSYFVGFFLLSAVANTFLTKSSINNLFWSLFTYGSSLCTILVFLCLPFRKEDAAKVFSFSLYLTFFQAIVGYVQMLAAQSFSSLSPFAVLGPAAGDYFVGTTFDFGIGNIVAIKMSLTTILFLPIWFANRNFKNSLIMIGLVVGWILPSAIYTLLIGFLVIFYFFVVRGSHRSVFTFRMRPSVFYAMITSILLLGTFLITQRENLGYATESIRQIYLTALGRDVSQVARKVVYYRETLTELPLEYPWVPFVGVGPGNYSSRSAWIVSGEYLVVQPSYIPVTPSKVATDYTIALWGKRLISDEYKGGGSITNQPFSTWLSILAEMGVFALFAFAMLHATLYQAFAYAEKNSREQFHKMLAVGMLMATIYLSILYFVDNIFEWPMVVAQFIIFGALSLRQIENELKEGIV